MGLRSFDRGNGGEHKVRPYGIQPQYGDGVLPRLASTMRLA